MVLRGNEMKNTAHRRVRRRASVADIAESMFQIFKRLREIGRTLRESTFARERERERDREIEGSGTSSQLQQLGATRCDYEGRIEGEFNVLRKGSHSFL